MNVFSLEGTRDAFGVGIVVMVSEHCPRTVRRGQLTEQLRARFGGGGALPGIAEKRNRNEVSGQSYQIRMQAIYEGNRGLQGMDGKERVVVKIAEERDGKSIHALGQAWQSEVVAHEAGQVRLDENSVATEGQRTGCGGRIEKLTSCDVG